MNNTLTTEAQELKRQKRREANKRANDRARQVPGVHGFEILVREAYDPQAGIGLKKPGNDRNWSDHKRGFPTASRLLRHADRKESLSITWGTHATIRVIDADAHGVGVEPMAALPALWEAVQALHFGRGVVVPDLVSGCVPDGVRLDGVIVTSPNGLHYMERTADTSPGDRLAQDNARVLACFARYGVEVKSSRIEVFPSSNGQSRLALGHGTTFVYPALGDVDFLTGLEILSDMTRVRRDFPDVVSQTQWVPTLDEGGEGGRGVCSESVGSIDTDDEHAYVLAQLEEQRAQEEAYSASLEHDARPIVSKSNPLALEMKKLHRQARKCVSLPVPRVPTLDEGGEGEEGVIEVGSSEFVERMESLLVIGASLGGRNREFWELCFYLRLRIGMTREQTENRMIRWIETAPHQSKDLASILSSKRNAARRTLTRHLNELDARIASGEFVQYGNGTEKRSASNKIGDAVLLNPTSAEQIASFYDAGSTFLSSPDGESLISDQPEWIKSTLPVLVGAVMHWSRGNQIALPVDTVKEYARTRKSKQDPFDGVTRPAYQILVNLLERFGVVSGIIRKANKPARLAAVYETNTEVNEEAEEDSRVAQAPKDDARVHGAPRSFGIESSPGAGDDDGQRQRDDSAAEVPDGDDEVLFQQVRPLRAA